MAKGRFRLQFKFWLDMNKSDEYALAETIAELKEAKTFSRAVRDGIYLIVDLWRGNLHVLLDLFPWVEEAFYERFREQQPEPDHRLHKHLVRLERLLLEQGITPIAETSKIHGGPKPLAVPALSGPELDDDSEMLRITKTVTSSQAAQNFLSSAFGLQQ